MLDAIAPTIGDRLPAERALAATLGCSRETLRAALDVLEAEGVLWRHVGQGTFRGRRPSAPPYRERLTIETGSVHELMRARLLVEPAIAGEAALLATPEDVRHLRSCVGRCRSGIDSPACEQADSAFHAAIAAVAGNAVLQAILRYLSDARRRALWQREWDRTYRRVGVAEFRGVHSDQHARIVDAIGNRDRGSAESAMRAHLETISAVLELGHG